MSLPTSRLSYPDCYDAFDKALANELGIRIRVADYDKALFFRTRLHNARKIDRREKAKIYELGDPRHGVSPYDPIVVRIKNIDGTIWVYLERMAIELKEFQPLTEVNDEVELPAPPETEEVEELDLKVEEPEPGEAEPIARRF